jgi:hypothetical protein
MKKPPFVYSQIQQNTDVKTGFFVFLSMQHILEISLQQMRFSSLENTRKPA